MVLGDWTCLGFAALEQDREAICKASSSRQGAFFIAIDRPGEFQEPAEAGPRNCAAFELGNPGAPAASLALLRTASANEDIEVENSDALTQAKYPSVFFSRVIVSFPFVYTI